MTALQTIETAVKGCQLVRNRKDSPGQYDCKDYYYAGKKKNWIYLDSFTASNVMNVYNAVKPEHKAQLEKLSLIRLVDFCWKLIS